MKAFVDEVAKTASAGEISEHPPCPGAANGAEAEECSICPVLMRKEAVNDAKRDFIMDAALRVIARDGYISARLEDIAGEAGFSKASIYHYFPDKEALIMQIVLREQRATYDECMKIMNRGLSFLDTFREFGFTFYDRFFVANKFYSVSHGGSASSMSVMASLFASVTKHEDLLNASVTCKRDTHNLMVQVITKAKEDGILTVPVDDRIVCNFLVSFMQSFIMENSYNQHLNSQNGALGREDFSKMMDAMFTFISPWIKEGSNA